MDNHGAVATALNIHPKGLTSPSLAVILLVTIGK
jgi:hypothetical protein